MRRPFVWLTTDEADLRRTNVTRGGCHAPIRSRRRSSGGGGRQELSQSDQPVDRDFESQPAASPRTNRTSRTSPPGLRDDDSDGTFRSIVPHGPSHPPFTAGPSPVSSRASCAANAAYEPEAPNFSRSQLPLGW